MPWIRVIWNNIWKNYTTWKSIGYFLVLEFFIENEIENLGGGGGECAQICHRPVLPRLPTLASNCDASRVGHPPTGTERNERRNPWLWRRGFVTHWRHVKMAVEMAVGAPRSVRWGYFRIITGTIIGGVLGFYVMHRVETAYKASEGCFPS